MATLGGALSFFLPFNFDLIVLFLNELVTNLEAAGKEGNVFEVFLVKNLNNCPQHFVMELFDVMGLL